MMIEQGAGLSTYRIWDQGRVVGSIEGTAVSFRGFTSPTDAAWAAWEAHRGTHARQNGTRLPSPEDPGFVRVSLRESGNPTVMAGDQAIAELLPPAFPETENDEWGFQVDLASEKGTILARHPEVLLRARARVMWQAMYGAGMHHLMRQWNCALSSK